MLWLAQDDGSSSGDASAPVIAAAGDIACDPSASEFEDGEGIPTACRQGLTSELVVDADPTAVLPLGDLQYEPGTLDKFRLSYDPSWGRLKELTRPVPGNHEYQVPAAKGYFDYFNGLEGERGRAGRRGRGYYSYEIGNWHLIALNSNCAAVGGCGEGSRQNRWLEADLSEHPASCILAYWHHPLFSSGADHGGARKVAAFWSDLRDADADVILNGHEHLYERFAPQDPSGDADPEGIRQFTVGTGGHSQDQLDAAQPNSEVRKANTFGVLTMTLRPAGYDWRFLPEAGSAFTDAGSGRC